MYITPGVQDELRWFHEARFGMFAHFGLYALLGRGEWVQYREKIPRTDYSNLTAKFNPNEFRASDWVDVAQGSGARYMTVTAKHHDGFCLFDSSLTDFKITNTQFGRDLIGELAAECKSRGMPLILYYSQPDWHHPNFVHSPGAFKDLDPVPDDQVPDQELYTAYYHGQVEELCKNYPIDGIWFDGSHKSEQFWKGEEIYRKIKRMIPHAVVNERARYGDFFTPERSLPEDLTGYMFEACQSVCVHAWGYREQTDYYSVPFLLRSLQTTASAGGNFLLNVGPGPDGRIPKEQVAVMTEVGRWLDANGSSIYGTEAAQLNEQSELLKATCKEDRLYLHLLSWPDSSSVKLTGLGPVKNMKLLQNCEEIYWRQEHGHTDIRIPPVPVDGNPAVVEIDLQDNHPVREMEPEKVGRVLPVPIGAEIVLDHHAACFRGFGPKGSRLHVADVPGYGTCIQGWMDPDQHCVFVLDFEATGIFEIEVDYAAQKGMSDGLLAVDLDSNALEIASLEGTYDEELGIGSNFGTIYVNAGKIEKGRHDLILRPERLHWDYIFCYIGEIKIKKRSGKTV